MDYVELEINFKEVNPWRDIAVSELSDWGFESFVETKTGLLSYIPVEIFNEEIKAKVNDLTGVSGFDFKNIPDENWNSKWEENFNPVYVEDKLAIVAPFHKSYETRPMVIEIQPQMSFGTGHHQTTWLISKRLFGLDLDGKSVLDMGTGTGVLAILAEKLGATDVDAPDIDIWSYENAKENAARNSCQYVKVFHGGHELINKSYDLVIANINKNVLIENFSVYSNALESGGKLLLSGFFTTDESDLIKVAENFGFNFEQSLNKDEWSMLEFNKK